MTKFQTLILLIFILVIPLMGMHYWVYKQNKKADEEYKRKLEDIEKRYGTK